MIDIGKEFYHRLTNRDKYQGDGKNTAEEFRKKLLKDFDSQEAWKTDKKIIFDFKNVKKLGPSFANEAFAYFTKYAKPEEILKKFIFENISEVKKMIIEEELKAGYRKKFFATI